MAIGIDRGQLNLLNSGSLLCAGQRICARPDADDIQSADAWRIGTGFAHGDYLGIAWRTACAVDQDVVGSRARLEGMHLQADEIVSLLKNSEGPLADIRTYVENYCFVVWSGISKHGRLNEALAVADGIVL